MKDLSQRTYAKLNEYCSYRRIGVKSVCSALVKAGLATKERVSCGRRMRYEPTPLAEETGFLSSYTGRNSGLRYNIRALDYLMAFGSMPSKIWKPSVKQAPNCDSHLVDTCGSDENPQTGGAQ